MPALCPRTWVSWTFLFVLLCPSGASSVVLTEGAEARVRRENVVIVFDPRTGQEEIFWEILLDGVPAPFAWLIPLPPDAEVEVLPFGLMGEFTRRYPLNRPSETAGKGYRHVDLRKGAGRRRPPPVKPTWVLPTAETFPGEAMEAISARLTRLDLVGQAPTGAGTVALLHVNEAGVSRARVAVRLSFPTRFPIFPYAESVDVGADGRRLTGWVVSPTPVTFIAGAREGRVTRPWGERERYRASRAAVRAALGRHRARLPGEGQLWVQTFEDEKADRTGYGPVVGIPETWMGSDADQVVGALGHPVQDPVFARLVDGRGALSELPLDAKPRLRVEVWAEGGGAVPPRTEKSMKQLFTGCARSADAQPVIEFVVVAKGGRPRIESVSERPFRGEDKGCLLARAGALAVGESWSGEAVRVRMSRR